MGEGCRRSLRVLRGAFPMACDWSAGDRRRSGKRVPASDSSSAKAPRQEDAQGAQSGAGPRVGAGYGMGQWPEWPSQVHLF